MDGDLYFVSAVSGGNLQLTSEYDKRHCVTIHGNILSHFSEDTCKIVYVPGDEYDCI